MASVSLDIHGTDTSLIFGCPVTGSITKPVTVPLTTSNSIDTSWDGTSARYRVGTPAFVSGTQEVAIGSLAESLPR
jgi:hypothetical protein